MYARDGRTEDRRTPDRRTRECSPPEITNLYDPNIPEHEVCAFAERGWPGYFEYHASCSPRDEPGLRMPPLRQSRDDHRGPPPSRYDDDHQQRRQGPDTRQDFGRYERPDPAPRSNDHAWLDRKDRLAAPNGHSNNERPRPRRDPFAKPWGADDNRDTNTRWRDFYGIPHDRNLSERR